MGNFLIHSGISDRLFRALNLWLSGIRGGLALVSVGVCVALAMCGGFGPGILTMGLIAVPAMLKQRYNKSLALGSVMAGGVLGEIIPPSIIMIIFCLHLPYIHRQNFLWRSHSRFYYRQPIHHLHPGHMLPQARTCPQSDGRNNMEGPVDFPQRYRPAVFAGGFGVGIYIFRDCHADRSRRRRCVRLFFGLCCPWPNSLESDF